MQQTFNKTNMYILFKNYKLLLKTIIAANCITVQSAKQFGLPHSLAG